MDFFRILQGGTGVGMSNFDRLWSQKFNDNWPIITLSGSLPLTFLSKGDALNNYRVYGTSSGVGDETENLWDGKIEQGGLSSSSGDETSSYTRVRSDYIYIQNSGEYTVNVEGAKGVVAYIYDSSKAFISAESTTSWVSVPFTKTINSGRYVRMAFAKKASGSSEVILPFDISQAMLVSSSTAPASYIPYGYQIPLTNTNGQQSETYPLYIGDTKLGAEEYLDYESGKIYKKKPNLVSGIIQNASVNSSGKLVYNDALNSAVTPIEQNKTYTMLYARGSGATSNMICGFFENPDYPELNDTTYNGSRLVWNAEYRTFTAPITGYLVSSCALGVTDPVVYEGEYPQLAPTDPPVPFPSVQTFSGENTLDSTETIEQAEITGKIKAKENENESP